MTPHQKRLLAKFWATNFHEGDPDLETLHEMQDIYQEVYQANRLKKSFNEARIMGFEAVIEWIEKEGEK